MLRPTHRPLPTTLLALALALPAAAWAKPAGKRAAAATIEASTDLQDEGPSSMVGPSTRAMFATFSVAPAFGLSTYSATQVKLGQTFGYHFSGDGSGFALGIEIQESLGSRAFALNVGPKAWYDFSVSRDYGVYLAPTVMMGLGYASVDNGWYYGTAGAVGFDMQFGLEAKVVLANRGLFFVRPFTIDIGIGDQVSVRYDLVFGGGATF